MKGLLSLFRFYINASIHVAFAVLALAGVTVVTFDLKAPFAFWLFLFFGTISGYNFVKYAKVAGLHHRSLTHRLQVIQVFSFLCFAVFFFSMFYMPIEAVVTALGFGLLTFFYAVPLLRKKNLRTFSGLKIFIVSMVWSGATVMVPVMADGMVLDADFCVVFVQRFLLAFALTLPFEIRDVAYDQLKLKTVPQQIGIGKTKGLGMLCLTSIVLLEGFRDTNIKYQWYAMLVVIFLCGFLLGIAKKKQSRYFASFWVESIPIVWLCLLILFRHFLA